MLTQYITNINEFREKLAMFIERTNRTKEPLTVVRHGKPMVVVIASEDFDAFSRWRSRRENSIKGNKEERLRFVRNQVQLMSSEIKKMWKGKNKNHKFTSEEIDAYTY